MGLYGKKTPVSIQAAEAKVQALEKDNQELQRRLGQVTQDNFLKTSDLAKARAILRELLTPCPLCRERPLLLEWNMYVCILTCGNGVCRNFHRPIKTIHREDLGWASSIESQLRKMEDF